VKLLCRDCQCWEDSNHGYGDCHRHAKQSGACPVTDEADYCFDGIPKVKPRWGAQTGMMHSSAIPAWKWFGGSDKCVLCAGWPEAHKKWYESGVCNKNCRFTPDEVAENNK
jgi:hypothetical protein